MRGLLCRLFGHIVMETYSDFLLDATGFHWLRHRYCGRCDAPLAV